MRRTLAEIDRRDRRAVGRALGSGGALADPGQAAAAVALAGPFARVLDGLLAPGFRFVSFASIPLAAWLQAVLFGGGLVRAAVFAAVLLVLQLLGDRRARRLAANVRRSEALNRRVADEGAGEARSNL